MPASGGECLLRIGEHRHGPRGGRVGRAIQESLRWLGIDWDGPVMFQLDRMELPPVRAEARGGRKAYDEGAIRFRQHKEGTVSWVDAVRGEIEFRNELLPDLVIVRSDGRPTYNFVSPVDDIIDGITHVIRAEDHVSNTPSQINILRALDADLPVYAHVPNINGDDGKKLSKRHGAISVDVFRDDGYLPAALMNFLALLGWSFDDKTTIMSRHELIERFSLERVVPSPATFDYKKLDWMNGMYLRLRRTRPRTPCKMGPSGASTGRDTATAPAGAGEYREVSRTRLRAVLFEDVYHRGADPRTCRGASGLRRRPWRRRGSRKS